MNIGVAYGQGRAGPTGHPRPDHYIKVPPLGTWVSQYFPLSNQIQASLNQTTNKKKKSYI